MQKFQRYHESISYLEGLSNLPIEANYMLKSNNPDLYLKRMRYFLNLIGNPDKNLKFIHITGTAGKGTVTNMIHEVIFNSGKKVGSFTSPFVTTSIEKIKVQDKYISPDEFAIIVDYLKPYIDKAYLNCPYGRPSYFELFFAIALIYFKKEKCDFIVLEVGLGGRYDATNVIRKPIITAITNIDYDHTEILGKTLKKIAYDKAGIIKTGSRFFTCENRKHIINLFKDICKNKKVKFNKIKKQEDYLMDNIALVEAICRELEIESDYIKNGIDKAKLQCRFEIMQDKPLIVIDGAHNRAKIKSTINNLKKLKFDKLHLIIGVAENKDSDSIFKQIIPFADSIILTRFQIKDRKCAHPKRLLNLSKKYLKSKSKVKIFLDSEQAFVSGFKMANKNDLILITGSFFLAGEIREKWITENWVLENRRSFKSEI